MSFNKCNNTNPIYECSFTIYSFCTFCVHVCFIIVQFVLQFITANCLLRFIRRIFDATIIRNYLLRSILLFTQKSIVFALYICHVFRLCVKARHSYANCWLCSSSSRPLNSISKSDVSFRDVSTERLLLASFFIVFSCRVRLAFVIPTAAIFA